MSMPDSGSFFTQDLGNLSGNLGVLCGDHEFDGICYVSTLSLLVGSQSFNDYRHLPRTANFLHGTLTKTMRWICAPRTRSERETILHETCRCRDSLVTAGMHSRGRRLMSSQYGDGCSAGLALMIGLLRFMKDVCGPELDRKRFVKLERLSSRQDWPTAIEQVLPYGAEGTIRGLLSWLSVDFGSAHAESFVWATRMVLQLTRALTLPYIVTSCTFLTYGILRLMERACAMEADHTAGQILQPTHEAGKEIFNIFSAVLAMMTQIWAVWMDRPLQREFIGHQAPRLVDACQQAWGICIWYSRLLKERVARGDHRAQQDAALWDGIMPRITILGRELMCCFPAVRRNPTLWGAIPTTTWTYMLRQNARFQAAGRCASPECMKTVVDDVMFRRCAGCKRAIYCSRSCQAIAWRHPVVPHRAVCQNLAEFCARYKLSRHDGPRLAEPQGFDEEAARWLLARFAAQSEYELAHHSTYISEAAWNARMERREGEDPDASAAQPP